MHEQLFAAIRADHQEILSLLLRLQEAGGERERKKILHQLLGDILPHMIGEEQVVYPALRPDAAAAVEAEQAMDEHRRAQDTLRRLRDMPPEGEAFGALVGLLREEIEEHLRWEEERIFAALRRVLSERHAGNVLESFRREKELAWHRYPDLPLPTSGVGEIRV